MFVPIILKVHPSFTILKKYNPFINLWVYHWVSSHPQSTSKGRLNQTPEPPHLALHGAKEQWLHSKFILATWIHSLSLSFPTQIWGLEYRSASKVRTLSSPISPQCSDTVLHYSWCYTKLPVHLKPDFSSHSWTICWRSQAYEANRTMPSTKKQQFWGSRPRRSLHCFEILFEYHKQDHRQGARMLTQLSL